MIKAVVFDFGGVLAEEGFREGLKAIARKNGLPPEEFFSLANELVYATGYLLGRARERDFWQAIREKTGIKSDDEGLREELLQRFLLRPEMLDVVKKLKDKGFIVAILSDQTDWLDELNRRRPFFHLFDHVFNSYHIHKGKRDPSVFVDICKKMGIAPEEVLFVDDNGGNIDRARSQGLETIHFKGIEDFIRKIKELKML